MIQSNVDIPWHCEYVKYWVSSINFNANMYNITDQDYIEINDQKIEFPNMFITNTTELLNIINSHDELFSINDDNRLRMTNNDEVVFNSISTRAKMLCGLMNVKIGYAYEAGTWDFDIPIFDYANKLYLISKQGNAIHTNIGNQEYTPSIIASIDTVIRKGLPVIVNFETYGKPIKNIANVDSFKFIEVQLVDMMIQPVQLLSPMFVNIKMKPCKVPQARLKE